VIIIKQNKYVEPDINTKTPIIGILILISMGVIGLIIYLKNYYNNKKEIELNNKGLNIDFKSKEFDINEYI